MFGVRIVSYVLLVASSLDVDTDSGDGFVTLPRLKPNTERKVLNSFWEIAHEK
jgi:hypothetical protein